MNSTLWCQNLDTVVLFAVAALFRRTPVVETQASQDIEGPLPAFASLLPSGYLGRRRAYHEAKAQRSWEGTLLAIHFCSHLFFHVANLLVEAASSP